MLKKALFICVLFCMLGECPIARAASINGTAISGTSDLAMVYIAIQDPSAKTTSFPVKVIGGKFSADLPLRSGRGKYKVWTGDNPRNFSGTPLEVVLDKDIDPNLSFSGYVDINNSQITATVESIIPSGSKKTTREKVKLVHDWVCKNIKYDYQSYISGANNMSLASTTINTKCGMCRDYSFVFAALARKAGISTRVVYGDVKAANGDWMAQKHAWNQVLVDGTWYDVDCTQDAGVIRNKVFVAKYSDKLLMFKSDAVGSRHKVTSITPH